MTCAMSELQEDLCRPGRLSSTAPAPIIRGGGDLVSRGQGGTGRGEGEEGGGEENIV